MQKRLFFLFAIVMFLTSPLMAQVTTSGINGKVVAGGEEVVGATVVAVHNPSGTRYNGITNEKGRYSIQGMRVGGPYTITISYVGYKNEVVENINLALGEASVLNADLKEDARLLGEVTVTGKAGVGTTGASTQFSKAQIDNTPTVSRNIYDVATLSPLVKANKKGGITIAGTNNRYNSFQIDGMVSNDVFGLSSGGTNGDQTNANPIALDAVEQIQVVASPFDIRQSGFTGGAINAITKSGTNDFKASAYTYYTDENLYGRWNQNTGLKEKYQNESTKTFGATFGGPIVKNKLFFFVSAEYKKNTYPATYYAGAPNYFMTLEMAKAIADRYESITGIREDYSRPDITSAAFSLMSRIDWNISNNTKFSFRYQFNDSHKDEISSSYNVYNFVNSGFKRNNHMHSLVAELNSRFSSSLYNELRVGLTMVRDRRDIRYKAPLANIKNAGAYDPATGTETAGDKTINIGTEYSSGLNALEQNIWVLEDNLSWYMGNHNITFGTHNELYDMKNAFMQAYTGRYIYGSKTLGGITGFMTDKASEFTWNYADANVTGTREWKTPFQSGQLGFYVQDKWDLNTLLQFTYGVRFDIPFYLNSPSTNDQFNASEFSSKYDAVVGRKPKSMVMFSPRLGFRWYMDETHRTMVRGGLGIFNGRAPFVWIENAWANTGIEQKGVSIRANDKTGAVAPSFEQYKNDAEAAANAPGLNATAAKPNIATVAHNFKFPQVFRTNLAWEQQLPWDMKFTLEWLYSRNLNNVWFENLALVNDGKSSVYAVEGADNSSTIYYSSKPGGYYSIINMTNTNKGYSYSLSAQVEKSFKFGLDLMANYTFGRSYSVHDGTSSVAASNWGFYYNVDPNEPVLAPSMFDVPHRVVLTANYNSKRYGNGRWQTHVGLTYNGTSGQRYSLTMSDKTTASFNGDYRGGNSLLYIPTKDELARMKFVDKKVGTNIITADQQKAQFEQWIESDDYARKHRGQYATRNSHLSPWENRFDLHISQDFFYMKERGGKVELVFDILNVANLLNKDWGTTYGSVYNINKLQVQSVDDGSAPNTKVASFQYFDNTPHVSDVASRWHAQIGLRVTF